MNMEPSKSLQTTSPITLDQCIDAWLSAKIKHTSSAQTKRAYTSAITHFRATLQSAGLDLTSDATLISTLAQGWAGVNQDGGDVSPSTFNQRLAILSSFYRYAIPRQVCMINPIDLVEKQPRHVRDAALPLESDEVAECLRRINRDTLEGQRDFALLSVALTTGRRVSELAALRWADLHFARQKIIVTWRHCKGGKVMTDELEPEVSSALTSYLKTVYGTELSTLPANAPIWISLSRNNQRGAIGSQSIADICKKRFTHDDQVGTSKVHALRHTFAVAMDDAGASVYEIGERLGHENIKTTSDYMKRQRRAKNRHASKLVDMFGIE